MGICYFTKNIWFFAKSKIYFNKYKKHIVNIDESFFRFSQINGKIWREIGEKTSNNYTNSKDKSGFTFDATISYEGLRYPLEMLSNGTTERCEHR